MSSSPRTERPRRRWSLRRRLIVQLAALLALVCLVVGVVTELALRDFLLGQRDAQLTAASERARNPPPDRGRLRPPGNGELTGEPPRALGAFGQPVGTIAVSVESDGDVRSGILRSPDVSTPNPANQVPYDPLAADQLTTVLRLPVDGTPRTVAVGALGDYRVVALRDRLGQVQITGLPIDDVSNTLLRLGFIFGGVAAVALLVVGGAGALTVRRTLRPLNRVAQTASQVAELPLDRGEVALPIRVSEVDTDRRTEVGQVGAALNQLLGHVAAALSARQASESRVRQFVADASHELRTPLAAIRGYTELTRRRVDDLPGDVVFALSRVDSESRRMTHLVEELLLLARLDSGRTVVPEPVDLSRLVADAVADAHAAGPEHVWRLDAPAEPITVLGEPGQLHQVVLNLLANARTHTPAGTVVTARLSTVEDGSTGERVRLVVADDGPGIDPEILPSVFERFARGDSSRSRAAGSTGLGLAIVAAVVAAHHGEVSVRSEPGRTEFTVDFPAHPAG